MCIAEVSYADTGINHKRLIHNGGFSMKLKLLYLCVFVIIVLVGWYKLSDSKNEEAQNNPKRVIHDLVTATNEKDWDTYIDLQADINKNDYRGFINNPENKKNELGLFNINAAKVIEIQPLTDYVVSGLTKLYQYQQNYNDIQSFLVSIDYKVKHEDKYHHNGINYRLVVVVKENDKWRIIEMSNYPHKN